MESSRAMEKRDKTIREAVLFVAVGVFNTSIGYAIFALLWALLGSRLHYLSILGITYGLVMFIGFIFYRKLVFQSTAPWMAATSKYVVVVFGSAAINSLALIALIEYLNLPVLVSQIGGVVMAATFSYLLHKYWTFRW